MMVGEVKRFPIELEYAKNPSISPEDIGRLREWLRTQPHLPADQFNDLDLMLAYHSCERSMEVTKQVFDLHYTLRTVLTPYFKDRKLEPKIERSINTILYAPLPLLTVHGYRAIYLRIEDPDVRNFNLQDIVRTFMMIIDLWQYEEGTWPGSAIIMDLEQMSLAHIGKLEVGIVRDVLYFVQECLFVKLKEVHFINAPYYMDKVMMLLKPFMKKSLMDLINIHLPKTDTIYKFVPKEAFPKEEGGEHKDHKTINEEMLKRLYINQDFFKRENLRRVNEALRPGGQIKLGDQFGIQGSFKKLDID